MQIELKALQREVGIAFVFITHDQEEAMVMSDRIALLKGGRLEQIATPREIYSRPATSYVAQFIGHTNLLRGTIAKGIASCGSLRWPVQTADGVAAFSVRPESLRTASGASNNSVQFEGRVQHQAFHGPTEMVRVECADGLVFLVRLTGAVGAKIGDAMRLEFSPQDAIAVRDMEAA
jgi:ABC-type Fe3+/spermidine/putrescine transport system ATPase subunit